MPFASGAARRFVSLEGAALLAIDDLEAAAELCERFAHRAWKRVLNAFARRLNPMLPAIGAAG